MLYTNYLKRTLLAFCALSGLLSSASAAISITEVMPCNSYTLLDTDNYNFSGYIELYNTDADTINLKGFTIDHFNETKEGLTLKWSHTIEKDFLVPGNGFNLLWADETSKLGNHIPYKLDTDGGRLFFHFGDIPLDILDYSKQVPGISFGRFGSTSGYMLPTPLAQNTEAHATINRTKAPVFSVKGGLKTEAFQLSLSCADAGSTIFFTTNGDIPTTASQVYTEPIWMDSTHGIRAMAVSPGKLPSATTTHSYIFPDDLHANCGGITLPVVNIAVNHAYFYDQQIGMSIVGKNGKKGEKDCTRTVANYNQDWKRPVSFQYIVGGEQVFSQEVEAAVEGGCSRGESVKSISLKASKKTGASDMPYHFFQSKPDLYHKTLHVRNGGTAYKELRFRDGLMQTFAIGMNIDYQAYQPVAYYINGKYQGLMNLNERTNADYIKTNYGIDEENIDLITLSDQLKIRASKGDLTAYKELTEYLSSNDQKDPDYFPGACLRMDMDEYIDYQVFQQFIVNTDWPGNNTKIWRERKDGSRFRWILFDTDLGLGLSGFSYLGNETKNMISWCLGKSPTQWANNATWMTEIFSNLSRCPEFKKKFTTKFLIHLATTFSDNRINNVFDSILPLLENEYCAYKGYSVYTDAKAMRNFALKRAPNILSHLKGYTGSTGNAGFTLSSNVEGATFTINGEMVAGGFNGQYLTAFESEIKAYPPAGYTFAGWQVSDSAAFSVKSADLTSACNLPGKWTGSLLADGSLMAVFVPETATPNTLLINEICASSNAESGHADDYGTYPDWIEIRNFGPLPIDLAGFSLSTSKNDLGMSTLPYGSDKTIVPANSHLLIWAKGDAVDGALYLNFKLNVDKRKDVFLTNTDGTIVSQAYYDTHNPNESYGWEFDELKNWVLFDKCADKGYTATPGQKNLSSCSAIELIDSSLATNVRLYPNPATDQVTVESDEKIERIEVFNANGRLVKQIRPNNAKHTLNISLFPAGIYAVKVQSKAVVSVIKLVKE